ncbi:efflux RND transporter permease subunit [Ectothiorhodospira lacustris]|uniref:efflux RND transporter permease subunit n=1 Tax=Ectothiorhodospira lacustris TaxID=2899127 RepID=UPI001EE7F9DF|nr:efflux RND transporter permease subunit [Ectothiorhodospira lacustris]MCG5510853.1 efflux RND transporter permease subunit [Ectothiorhodospira lacustris]MCG5522601.1 efflux RND transporter permease subunit [Ectothiorhodospira lacustris]
MLRSFLENHFLANAVFLVALLLGLVSYLGLPRQQDPTVNLNWVGIQTFMPGASASDIEQQITDVIEGALERVSDIRFISSTSRQDISLVLVRFENIRDRVFEERVRDIRREVQNVESILPLEARRPRITTASSANAFPTTLIAVVGKGQDENLRFQAQLIQQDLERHAGIDRIDTIGLQEPELQVLFEPSAMMGLGLTPSDIADTVQAYFRDLAAGRIGLGEQEWLVRLRGTDNDPEYLANLPLISRHGEIPLRSVAEVLRGKEDPDHLARFQNQPAIILTIFKKDDVNSIELLEEINGYLRDYNKRLSTATGVEMVLLDDQTLATRVAIATMERNAALGLLFVLFTTWLLLGSRIAFATCLSVVFALAGTFLILGLIGQTLNIIVLLGLVIVLGMLVDDTVVVAEAIHYRVQSGMPPLQAALDALHEVAAPVIAAVLTTIAAFLPLMLVPGVLGDFMRVAPIVVAVALLLSLLEVFWMLPNHIITSRPKPDAMTRSGRLRQTIIRRGRTGYARLLVQALRHPKLALSSVTLLLLLALTSVITGLIRTEFFATDSARLFYINVNMPSATPIERTLQATLKIEGAISDKFLSGELNSIISYAGVQFTMREDFYAGSVGQIMVSLHPQRRNGRSIDAVMEIARKSAAEIPGPTSIGLERQVTGAPPLGKPVSIKVRGNDMAELREAADHVMNILSDIPAAYDVTDDAFAGQMELSLQLNPDAIMRAGLNPAQVVRDLRLFTDGEVVASMRDRGETLNVRVRATPEALRNIDSFLHTPVSLPEGGNILLGALVTHEITRGEGNIRHFNLRRTITVEASVDEKIMDVASVNRRIINDWRDLYADRHPNVDLDLSGDFDDILESIEAITWLFMLGLLLIYLILGTQFRSYIQPLIVIAVVPMALTGVLLGLLATQNPLSVFTLYGVVALAGIAVNNAIVLISAANDRQRRGMSIMHAAFFAARRRLIPIVITSTTTIAGLFALAIGLGGKSLIWGPLASAIVWGLMVSTILTLFVIPVMYSLVVRPAKKEDALSEVPALPIIQDGRSLNPSLILQLLKQGALAGASQLGKNPDLEKVGKDSTLRELYNAGRHAMMKSDYESAIRIFERGARLAPESSTFHLCEAQALLLYMKNKIGWDEGYMMRLRRYLDHGSRLAPNDARALALRRITNEFINSNKHPS